MTKLQTLTFGLLLILLSLPSMAKISEADSLVLVAFYEATNGETWTDNAEWLEGEVENWAGITLDETKNHITSISLPNNNLTGSLPSLILSNLRWLNLSGNQMEGTIPNFNLPSLENLALSGNELEGTVSNFSGMPKLQLLTLADNQLEGEIPIFDQLPNLKWLNLGGNQLEASFPTFTHNTQLTHIYLNDNQLNGVLPNLGHLPNLETCWLQNNQFTFDGLEENIAVQAENPIFASFRYAPQSPIDLIQTTEDVLYMPAGNAPNNQYHWYRNGQWQETSTENFYIVTRAGDYNCRVTNEVASDLNLQSKSVHFDHNKCTLAEPFALPSMATSEFVGPFNNKNMGNPVAAHTLAVCFEDASLDNLLWHVFEGDGEIYSFYIHSKNADAENGLEDAQIAVYEGICGELDLLVCNDNMSSTSNQALATLQTKPNQFYYLMVDGRAASAGEFFIETWKGESIWAGDTDNNGEVNHHDLLALGMAYDFEGSARETESSDFLPKASEEWLYEFNNGLNHHFADANGDGEVNWLDVNTIRQNYKQNHVTYNTSTGGLSPIDNFGIPLELTANLIDTIQEGYEYMFRIGTDENHPNFEDVLGVSMTLEILVAANVPDTVFVQAPVIFYNNSIIGKEWQEMITLDSLQLVEFNHYEWDVAMVRNDHKGVSTGGELCSIACIFSVGSIDKSAANIPMIVRLKEVKLLNVNQKPLTVQLPAMRFEIGESEDLTTSIEENVLNSLQFYPNPSRDWLHITPPLGFSNDLTVRFFDKNGAVVLQQKWEDSIDIRSLKEGLYWLQLEDKGRMTKSVKVVVI